MKFLLIEDEAEIANFLIRGLKYDGYKVDHCDNGNEAYQKLLQDKYELIILDIRLPGMNGDELLKKIRSKEIFTPVIILTGVDDMKTRIDVLNSGADDYLIKPFSFIELLARIKAVLRRAKTLTQHKEQIKVGELTLIPSMRSVSRKGKQIKLRLKEYALLEYLMRNPDEVVTRNTLLENVWDYNARIFSNTIDAHISSLRNKINQGFKKKLIETIHGIGYVLRSK